MILFLQKFKIKAHLLQRINLGEIFYTISAFTYNFNFVWKTCSRRLHHGTCNINTLENFFQNFVKEDEVRITSLKIQTFSHGSGIGLHCHWTLSFTKTFQDKTGLAISLTLHHCSVPLHLATWSIHKCILWTQNDHSLLQRRLKLHQQ